MEGELEPRLSILPRPQQRFWPELAALPASFTLYGGTAIALRLGHRESVDFDFFAPHPIDPRAVLADLPMLSGATVLQMEPNTLTVGLDREGPIKVSFFGTPKLGRLRTPDRTVDIGLAVASSLDLGGTKVSVVQVRAEAKDYIDIHALIASGLDLASMLGAGSAIYGDAFSPQAALKALAYFDDPDLATLSPVVRSGLRDAVRGVDLDSLPSFDAMPPWTRQA